MSNDRLYKKIAKRYGFKIWRKDRHGQIFERQYQNKTNHNIVKLHPNLTPQNAYRCYIVEQKYHSGESTYSVRFIRTDNGGTTENYDLFYNLKELRKFLKQYFK
jgi:hypothetical protein